MKSTILALFLASSTALYAADAAPFKIFTKKGDVTLEQLAGKVVYLDFLGFVVRTLQEIFSMDE